VPANGGGGEPPTETALVSLDCGGCIEARLLEPDDKVLGASKLLGDADVILRYATDKKVVQTKI